jgi:hypothetical protein
MIKMILYLPPKTTVSIKSSEKHQMDPGTAFHHLKSQLLERQRSGGSWFKANPAHTKS